jgi:hypothetical protein
MKFTMSNRSPASKPNGVSDRSSAVSLGNAANDSVSSIEPYELDSSVGSYERISQIRRRVLKTDFWTSIAMYAVLIAIVFLFA